MNALAEIESEEAKGVGSLFGSTMPRYWSSNGAMPRRLRFAAGGYVYHVLNRAVGRAALFTEEGDYVAFEKVVREALEQRTARVGGKDSRPL